MSSLNEKFVSFALILSTETGGGGRRFQEQDRWLDAPSGFVQQPRAPGSICAGELRSFEQAAERARLICVGVSQARHCRWHACAIAIGFPMFLQTTTAAKGLLLVSLNPLWAALLGWLCLGDKLPRRTIVALLGAGGAVAGLGVLPVRAAAAAAVAAAAPGPLPESP